jgi:leader peptidase (prepilin peptidase)/N-methyltransferase
MVELLFFAPPGSLWPTMVAGLFGLMIGSFLNVVIHRKPIMIRRETENFIAEYQEKELPHTDSYNWVVPRSACPHCGHQITALENIPLISYFLLLRGKCSNCKAPISLRYPLIEALTAALSALLIWHFGSDWLGLATLGFGFLTISMTVIDLDTMLLPDDLTYPLLWLGLLLNIQGGFTSLNSAVIGAVAGYMALWIVANLFFLLRNKKGMGEGDFILLAALGAWFGWQALPIIILLSSIVGATVGISMAVLGTAKQARADQPAAPVGGIALNTLRMLLKGEGLGTPMPFGPYLTGAGLLYLFYGKQLLAALYTIYQ